MNFFKLISIVFCVCVVLACQKGAKKQTIRAYYYPIQNFMEGKVYEYQAVNDSLAPFYWYFRTSIYKGDTIITGEYFDHNFVIQQLTNEQVVRNGAILNDFYLYETDSLTGKQEPNPVRVEVDNVFPFEVTDSLGLFLYKVSWKTAQQKYRLIKNRHYMGKADYMFKGKKVDCVQFLNRELLEIEEVGFQELTYHSIEWFAKDIGLVYFKKIVGGNTIQEYELGDIYDMSTLEEKFRSKVTNAQIIHE